MGTDESDGLKRSSEQTFYASTRFSKGAYEPHPAPNDGSARPASLHAALRLVGERKITINNSSDNKGTYVTVRRRSGVALRVPRIQRTRVRAAHRKPARRQTPFRTQAARRCGPHGPRPLPQPVAWGTAGPSAAGVGTRPQARP